MLSSFFFSIEDLEITKSDKFAAMDESFKPIRRSTSNLRYKKQEKLQTSFTNLRQWAVRSLDIYYCNSIFGWNKSRNEYVNYIIFYILLVWLLTKLSIFQDKSSWVSILFHQRNELWENCKKKRRKSNI